MMINRIGLCKPDSETNPLNPTFCAAMAAVSPNSTTRSAPSQTDDELAALARIRESLAELRYGEVVLKVQDGVLVQIDRTERIRLR